MSDPSSPHVLTERAPGPALRRSRSKTAPAVLDAAEDSAGPGRPGRAAAGSGVLPSHRPRRADCALAPAGSSPLRPSVRLVGPHGPARPRIGRRALLGGGRGTIAHRRGRGAIADAVRSARQGERPARPWTDGWPACRPPGLPSSGRSRDLGHPPVVRPRLERLRGAPTIGRDHWWDSPHSSLLAIRSRAEVRSVGFDRGRAPSRSTWSCWGDHGAPPSDPSSAWWRWWRRCAPPARSRRVGSWGGGPTPVTWSRSNRSECSRRGVAGGRSHPGPGGGLPAPFEGAIEGCGMRPP
jgi:hypothetical protein